MPNRKRPAPVDAIGRMALFTVFVATMDDGTGSLGNSAGNRKRSSSLMDRPVAPRPPRSANNKRKFNTEIIDMRIATTVLKSLAVALIAGATLAQANSGAQARDRIVPRMLDHVLPTDPALESALPAPALRRMKMPKMPGVAAGIADAAIIAAEDEECGEYLAKWLVTRKAYWRGRYDACRLD